MSSDNGSSGDNYTNTLFDDLCATNVTSGAAPFSGCFKPETLLSGFATQVSNGTWTLVVTDDTSSDSGTLNSWSLVLCTQ